ncbi:MAG: tRNA (N(6)-L-threonylcarbamoyladenosine(37)-C(2))-methylthiotransferase MtaB, partial [Rhodobacteraceae bacterium]|nr:tRNA (N(6)-L-threonylcarbamoyladenosine(37)-C(2))-methylthiotransferase MtaB [Paracoccaceae bacterium]
KTHQILMENPHLGRTEDFTEVSLNVAQETGQIITATISGHKDGRLLA